jgi:hypothetical protein
MKAWNFALLLGPFVLFFTLAAYNGRVTVEKRLSLSTGIGVIAVCTLVCLIGFIASTPDRPRISSYADDDGSCLPRHRLARQC